MATTSMTQTESRTLHLTRLGEDRDRRCSDSESHVTITYQNCNEGIGIKVIGGIDGIHVNKLLPKGLARKDGRLRIGDRVHKANGDSLENVEYTEALAILRAASASNKVTLVISRDTPSQESFQRAAQGLQEIQSPSSGRSLSSTPDVLRNGYVSLSDSQRLPVRMERSYPAAQNFDDISHWTPSVQTERSPIYHPSDQTGITAQVPPPTAISTPAPRVENLNDGRLIGQARASTPRSHFNSDYPNPSSFLSERHISTQPIDPSASVRMDKLERALDYLGLTLTYKQQELLQSRLKMDDKGNVPYGAFVSLVKELFHVELAARAQTVGSPDPVRHIQVDTPPFPTTSFSPPQISLPIVDIKPMPSQTPHLTSEERMMLPKLQQEKEKLELLVGNLQMKLDSRERKVNVLEEDMAALQMRLESSETETESWRSRAELAESALKAANEMEVDYQNVIEELELQVQEMSATQQEEMESTTVRKKLSMLACQLQKATDSLTTYQVTTQRLLTFAQDVYDELSSSPWAKEKTPEVTNLSQKALGCITTIHAMIEELPLPFGWEKVSTKDGIRYYMNHKTQETSWYHPTTKVSHILPQK